MNALSLISFRRAIAAASLLLAAGASHAALFEDDEARRAILDLRQKIAASESNTQRLTDELRRATEDNAQLRRSLLDLQSQIDAMRSDMARMTGNNEQVTRELAEIQRRQKDVVQSVDDRLRKFEPTKVSLDGKEFLADPAEMRDYDAALAIFRRGDFAAAQGAFGNFVKRYPQSGYNPSALFWLGNAQYATRDYKSAIDNFRQLLALSPDHVRAPEAVLSIANCQIELKDTRAARKTLEDLAKAYPQSEAAQAGKERLARLK
ncbi:tol-pal system protein YbgF [Variovorax sp. VNK109]|uniref:tol-pal system protein YbgF n=1 Tax=Variovorax sp. VNK109 TaxID=3400919 RepID=UPI003C049BBA